MQMKYLTAAVACALAVMSTGHAHAAQGVSSSQDAISRQSHRASNLPPS